MDNRQRYGVSSRVVHQKPQQKISSVSLKNGFFFNEIIFTAVRSHRIAVKSRSLHVKNHTYGLVAFFHHMMYSTDGTHRHCIRALVVLRGRQSGNCCCCCREQEKRKKEELYRRKMILITMITTCLCAGPYSLDAVGFFTGKKHSRIAA